MNIFTQTFSCVRGAMKIFLDDFALLAFKSRRRAYQIN